MRRYDFISIVGAPARPDVKGKFFFVTFFLLLFLEQRSLALFCGVTTVWYGAVYFEGYMRL